MKYSLKKQISFLINRVEKGVGSNIKVTKLYEGDTGCSNIQTSSSL